uniref:hypothetical protein n=1 Tax=Ciborinia camelliae TaxID=647257 RepID=UPI001FA6E315|nr:hypothetical protein MRV96_mgp04 [Ciborinia camelliae]UNB14684.1 hypothetical protein [Ciborinia camelliae]
MPEYLLEVGPFIVLLIFVIDLTILTIFLATNASRARPEVVEQGKAELGKQIKELGENRRERNLDAEQYSRERAANDPNAEKTAEDVGQWDELINEGQRTIVDIINWLSS